MIIIPIDILQDKKLHYKFIEFDKIENDDVRKQTRQFLFRFSGPAIPKIYKRMLTDIATNAFCLYNWIVCVILWVCERGNDDFLLYSSPKNFSYLGSLMYFWNRQIWFVNGKLSLSWKMCYYLLFKDLIQDTS